MTVGIAAPYNWSYATHAGCVLATRLTQLGSDVCWPVVRGDTSVHPTWDQHVLRLPDRRQRWQQLQRCQRVIWLGRIDQELHRQVRPAQQHHSVILLDQADAKTCRQWPHCDRLLSPLHYAYTSLEPLFPSLFVCGWDSEIPICHVRRLDHSFPRLLVLLDRRAARHRGRDILTLCQLLLEALPELKLTLALCGSLSRDGRPLLNRLLTTERFRLARRPTLLQRQSLYHQHDWLLPLTLGDPLGLYALEALAAHLPIVALRTLPYTELVSPREGRLLPCSAEWTDPLRLPQPSWSTMDLLRSLEELLPSTRTWRKLAEKEWPCVQYAREAFLSQWAKLLGLDDNGC